MKDKYKTTFLGILIFLAIFSIYALKPQMLGDSLLYTSSIEVLKTGIQPIDFIPMMISSTYLGLSLIMFFDLFLGNIAVSWLLLNAFLYVAMGLFFYELLKKFADSAQVAFWGTLFLITNYAVLVFGLGYMMDVGGWLAYVAALYFAYRYLEAEEQANRWIYWSALVVGLGGIYKEYAFVAYPIIFGVLIFKCLISQTTEINKKSKWLNTIWQVAVTGLISFLPFVLLNFWTYLKFDYTYLDWFWFNQGAYDYQNRVVEFIKSFGSIFNFGWFLFFPGFYLLLKRWREIFIDRNVFFVWLVLGSCSAVLLWPVVTRVLFITIPAIVLISSLFIKKLNNKQRLFLVLPLFIAYMISNYLMDAFVLNLVNINSFLKWLS